MRHTVFEKVYNQLQEGNPVDLVIPTAEGEVVRRFCPKERMILLGGGHVALPLATIGKMLDFSVIVVDDRPSFANRERFFMADQVMYDEFLHALRELTITPDDYVCIITRGHRFDYDCLRTILDGEMPYYLGMLGSRRRVSAMKEKLLEEGYARELLNRVHTPIGLDIHALTTSEIAVSITAEMISCRRKEKKKTIGFETDYLSQTNIDIDLLQKAKNTEIPSVLAVVVETKGSTPVKAGAMMLVGQMGILAGTIGGGCKEAEVIRAAREMVATGEEQMLALSLLSDFEEEEGMVCGGTMKVFLTDLTP